MRIRRRSGWPSKWMPNMSHTSRSIQFAPSHSSTTERTAGSGSFTKRRTVKPLGRLGAGQQVDQTEAIARLGIVQVVDAGDVHQQVEAVLFLKVSSTRTVCSAGTTTRASVAAKLADARKSSSNGTRRRSLTVSCSDFGICLLLRLLQEGSLRSAAADATSQIPCRTSSPHAGSCLANRPPTGSTAPAAAGSRGRTYRRG